MIIGIDARELQGKPTGVGAYLREILKRLRLPGGVSVVSFFRGAVPDGSETLPGDKIELSPGVSNVIWQQWTLPRAAMRRGVDLLFSPANSLPWIFTGFQVLTVHDISFFRNPEWFTARERLSRRINTSRSLRRADRIYTVSDFVKQELVSRFEIAAEKILVTPNGVAPFISGSADRKSLREAYGFRDAKIVLFVGSIFNRRRIPLLIQSLRHLDPQFRLVLIGENRTHPPQDLTREAAAAGVASRVEMLEYAPETTVQNFYRMADAFVYLSDYEGFGIPPLEAMAAGVPVVISDTPAMNTLFQSAALLLKDMSPEAVASAIREATASPSREKLILAGTDLAARYNWDETARIVNRDWEQIVAAIR